MDPAEALQWVEGDPWIRRRTAYAVHGCSERTIRRTLGRAHRKLAGELQRRGFDGPVF